MVRAADAEWRRWGMQQVRPMPGGGTCAVLADGDCRPVDDGCGREQAAALCPVVNDYWRALGPGGSGVERHRCVDVDVCEARWPAERGAPEQTPAWSAAFIGAVMRAAGFGETEFDFSAAHARYIVAARDRFASAFELFPTPAAVDVGDLVCAPRLAEGGATRPMAIGEIRDRDGVTAMHCDLVVALDLKARQAETIGGNVQQAVSRSTVALDGEGRLHWAPDADRGWMLVMKPRRSYTPLRE